MFAMVLVSFHVLSRLKDCVVGIASALLPVFGLARRAKHTFSVLLVRCIFQFCAKTSFLLES